MTDVAASVDGAIAITGEVHALSLTGAAPVTLGAQLLARPAIAVALTIRAWLGANLRARPRLTARLAGFSPRVDTGSEVVVRARAGELLDQLLWRAGGGSIDADALQLTLAANPGLASLGPRLPEGWPVVLPALPAPTSLPPERELIQLWDA